MMVYSMLRWHLTLMTKPPINQKFVAEQAGVSQSTVSLILSGRKVSSEATRIKVVETAERLGYRPNLLVHGIQTGKTRAVGVMAPPFDFFWTEILYGIHDTLVKADHVPINIWTSHHGTTFRERKEPDISPLEQIHRLLDRRVDGVILWPPMASLFHEHIKEFSSRDLPVVTIDHDLPEEFKADSVGSDEATGGALVVKHLWDLGHRRFAHLAGPLGVSWAQRRRAAFEQSLAKRGVVDCPVIEGDVSDPMQQIDPARALLSGSNPPTAIFAASDPLAKSVYKAAAERGLQIPRDLSVIGFADDDFAATMNPPLTTVRQPAYEIGCKAAELVLARSTSKSPAGKSRRITLPVSLIVRESTARVRNRP
jgi:LacI family transcriptional regulator